MRSTAIPCLALLATVASACGGDDGGTGDAEGNEGSDPMGDPIPVSCTGKSEQPVDAEWIIVSSGVERRFNVHVPSSYDPAAPAPVVLSFHGFTSNGEQQRLLANMDGKSDDEGFISVHPEGTGLQQSWNAGLCCGEAQQTGVDDVQFVRDILAELESRLCIDQTRIYATGMSNGGFMSHRLACELSDRIAAIGPVAGHTVQEICNPGRTVPVAHFHGTLDGVVPYNGNTSVGWPSVEETLEAWAARNGCSDRKEEIFRAGDSVCQSFTECPAGGEVILCTVEGGGHTWPGGLPVPNLGKTTASLSATDFMWDFFATKQLPAAN